MNPAIPVVIFGISITDQAEIQHNTRTANIVAILVIVCRVCVRACIHAHMRNTIS